MISRLRSSLSVVILTVVCCFAIFCCAPLAAQQAASIASRITAKIDDAQTVTLHGAVHPLANAANDRGALPDSTPTGRVEIVLKRSGAQEAALTQLLQDLHNPSSPSFHQWLTPAQFGAQFGPSDDDVAALTTWLAGKGFTVAGLKPGRQMLEFSGTAGQFRAAFGSEVHKYATPNGLRTSVNADPAIPAALAPVFGGFMELNNFSPRSDIQVRGTASFNPATHAVKPNWTEGTNGVNFVLAPGDFAVQYDLPSSTNASTTNTGTGQTIAIVNDSNINTHLVDQYRSLFSLPANPVQVIVDGADPGINGINNAYGQNGAATEAYLDVELAGAVAPGAKIDLVVAGDTALSDGLLLAAEHAVYSNVAPIISLSFGTCEANLGGENQFLASLWEQAAAQGITVLVSAGDGGSAGCDDFDTSQYATGGQAVSGFASTPYNIAVGGTDFYYSNVTGGTATTVNSQIVSYWNPTPSNLTPTVSIKSVIPEQAWNDTQYGLDADYVFAPQASVSQTSIIAGSGGASTCGLPTLNSAGAVTACAPYPKPAWQAGTGVPADGARDIPDVALFAANGYNFSFYPICAADGDCQPVTSGEIQVTGTGGTSASTPAFAGIMALVNQLYGRQGQADTVLYPLAKQYPAAFHDVTAGSNTVPCNLTTDPNHAPAKNCIASSKTFYSTTNVLEGEIGTGTTPEYNAGTGYDLATGLGSVDVSVLLADWNKVAFAGTTTTLTPSATTFAHGTNVTVTGSVKTTGSVTPTGQVAVMTTSGLPNNQGETNFTLASGNFSGALNYLPGGTYTLYGHYGGDTVNSGSSSTPVTLTITPETSATALVPVTGNNVIATGNSVTYGGVLTLEALSAPSAQLTNFVNCFVYGTVACPVFGSPTGTATFSDSGTSVNAASLNASGEASYVFTPGVGSHSISAAYSGDASYSASTSTTIAFTVAKATPLIGGGFNDLLGAGGVSTISILVENGVDTRGSAAAPSGTITLTGVPAGVATTATLVATVDPATGAAAGVATVTFPAVTTATNYTIGVSYPGDTNYNATTASLPASESPQAGTYASTIAASLNATTTSPNTALAATVTVTGSTGHGAPTSYVLAYTGGTFVNYCVLTSAAPPAITATCAIPLDSAILAKNNNVVTLQYVGDGNYLPSVTTVSISNPLGDFALTAAQNSLSVLAGSGTAVTDTISVGSEGGFTGAVSLTCTASTGVTCSLSAPSVTLTNNGSATSNLSVNTSGLTGTGGGTVVITATDSTGQHAHTAVITLIQSVPSTGASAFALSNGGGITLASQGATGTTGITITPSGTFSGAVNLTCAITSSPSGVVSTPTCAVTTPVTIAQGTAGTATLTINSTAPTYSALSRSPTEWYAATGVFAAFALLLLPGSRRRRWSSIALLALALVATASLSGCGGGTSNSAPTPTAHGGTTLGAYSVTVTGTDAATGKITASTVVNLTVN